MGTQNNVVNNSLIPIKGISQAQKKALGTKCQIYDISGLLAKGKTPSMRKNIAEKLGIDKSYVNIWVKQADLWRVTGMTADYAYLLVLCGVRCVKDLAKADSNKLNPILLAVKNTHPGFECDFTVLPSLIFNAALMESSSFSQDYLTEKYNAINESFVLELQKSLEENFEKAFLDYDEAHSKERKTKSPSIGAADITRKALKRTISQFRIDANKLLEDTEAINTIVNKSLGIDIDNSLDVSDESEPEYLFADNSEVATHGKSETEIIEEGLAFLQDITVALPLPHIISGKVKMRRDGENESQEKSSPTVANLLVELTGIVNPSVEATEGHNAISTYTDGEGHFILVMPDKYCMEDSVTFTFSNGVYKQSFVKQASEIIDNVIIPNGGKDKNGNPLTAQALVAEFDQLDSINKKIKQKELEKSVLEELEKVNAYLQAETDPEKIASYTAKQERLEKAKSDMCIDATIKELKDKITGLDNTRTRCLKTIYGADPTTNDLEKTLTNLMSRTDLESSFDADENSEYRKNKCFVLIEEVFKGYKDIRPKALPSVKLMGEGKEATVLPTDSAPSRTFNYNMIQRLVEPAIYPPVGDCDPKTGKAQRKKMEKPVDVLAFKDLIMKNPDNLPKMSSLGMGYSLNMHQAWVPDGFALGTLLYSLVLAPGEEQRLVIRERSETYQVTDSAVDSDETIERTSRSQTDDVQAIYDYVMDQQSTANSNSSFQTKSYGVGASVGGIFSGLSLGLSGSYSKSSGSSSASARQTNNNNEASHAAQTFNQQFSTAAYMLAKANRLDIRTATAAESDSVATKIIANHNHSHAMTVQYWEVVRRYRVETSIDSVDLLLFVPLDLIRFLPKGQELQASFGENFTKVEFKKRYDTILKYYTILRKSVPYQYRTGLDLVQRYASMPQWKGENITAGKRKLTYSVKGKLLEFDILSAYVYLKNGKGYIPGTIAGAINYTKIPEGMETTVEIERKIRELRAEAPTEKDVVTFTFDLPEGTLEDDISYIELKHSCRDLDYKLKLDIKGKKFVDGHGNEITYEEVLKEIADYKYDTVNDHKKTDIELGIIDYYQSQLPEAALNPNARLYGRDLQRNYELRLETTNFSGIDDVEISKGQFTINNYTIINVYSKCKHLNYDQFQQMEAALQHIASETLNYSQIIWQTLSTDELAMMLEPYTIDMNFSTYFDAVKDDIFIPLLNCVNVKRPIGFYGNCIMLPFTYPEALAQKLGKTAGEVQDALYRYHTSCFRAPSTTISIPTDGMIGEAVLGTTNVSEKIDLTRFWNWKDSPIDSMTIDSSYLSNGDYLGNKATKDTQALNLQTANQVVPVTASDLVSALVARQTPQFADITGLQQTAELLNNAMKTDATTREKVIEQSSLLSSKVLDYCKDKLSDPLKSNSKDTTKSKDKKKDEDKDEKTAETTNTEEKNENEESKNEDKEKDKEKEDSFNGILDGVVDAISGGSSPTEFFNKLTGSDSDDSSMKDVVDKFSDFMGSDAVSLVGTVMKFL